MPFQWDPRKDHKNRKKHGVSFYTATKVFDDPNTVVVFDEDHSSDEERFIAIGVTGGFILRVSYTMRDEFIRIISARPADDDEVMEYLQRLDSQKVHDSRDHSTDRAKKRGF